MSEEFENSWPYLTKEIPPIAFTIKTIPEDFEVEEIPAYEPCGKGNHLYLWIEKKGIPTHEAVRQISKAANISRKQIGAAGLKDARALTRQFISLEDYQDAGQKLHDATLRNIKILSMARHTNKLKTGHLKGNRFKLKLREVDPSRWDDFEKAVAFLTSQGIPNFFGSQRFGMRGDTWKIGRALLENNEKLSANLIAGMPEDGDTGAILLARQLFEKGEFAESARMWPRQFNHCVTLATALAKNGGNFKKGLYQLDRKILRFYISSFQSWIFNKILARRLHELDSVRKGDWAHKHVNGAVFLVQDEEGDSVRAKDFEISATGPLHGKKMRKPEGYPAQVERDVLAEVGVQEAAFAGHFLRCMGDRRPLRIKASEVTMGKGTDEHGFYFEVSFVLPSGAYATVFLREIAKDQMIDASDRPSKAGEPAVVLESSAGEADDLEDDEE